MRRVERDLKKLPHKFNNHREAKKQQQRFYFLPLLIFLMEISGVKVFDCLQYDRKVNHLNTIFGQSMGNLNPGRLKSRID